MKIEFTHRQSAHCESGVTANLLSYYGVPMSEAMAFGIGAGLFFGYIPFIKLNDLPLTTFRAVTGAILKRTMKELGVKIKSKKFRDPDQAMAELDKVLFRGVPVGIQTGAWWLPYFPKAFRFHFNMHNSVVIGKKDDEYLISDPVFPEPVVCASDDLKKARFAKGTLAPKGKMYYIDGVEKDVDLTGPIKNGIKAVGKTMLKTPLPIIGIKGIRFLANRLQSWPQKLGERKALLYLGQVVRMQEEIGTGGGGFRFVFAAFLQEASTILADARLHALSERMTGIGDRWREFAVVAARNCKGRADEQETFPYMADILRDCAAREEKIYRELLALVG